MKRALLVLVALAACGGTEKDATCSIRNEGDGTATLTCPGDQKIRVPLGNVNVTCTMSELPEGGFRIYCSNGLEVLLDEKLGVIFPGGGVISGTVALLGLPAGPGIRVTAGSASAVTDTNGFYRLVTVEAGIYEVAFDYPGYATETRRNIPAVGKREWLVDPVTLYPGHLLTSKLPTTTVLAPTDDSLLVSVVIEGHEVGPIWWIDLATRDSIPVASDASPPASPGAFRDDGGAIVWVEYTEPRNPAKQGSIVVRERSGVPAGAPARAFRGPDGYQARFVGSDVLYLTRKGTADELRLWRPVADWRPDADSTEKILDTASGGLPNVRNVIPLAGGDALLIPPGNGIHLWRRGVGVMGFGDRDVQVNEAADTVIATNDQGTLIAWRKGQPTPRIFGSDVGEAWLAPDGRSCAFTQIPLGSNARQLHLIDLVDGTRYTPGRDLRGSPIFSPDSETLLVSDLKEEITQELELIRVNTRSGKPETIGKSGFFGAAFGPDGEIIFQSDSTTKLMISRRDAVHEQELLPSVSSWRYEPTTRTIAATLSQNWLEVTHLDGGKPVVVWPNVLLDSLTVGSSGIVYEAGPTDPMQADGPKKLQVLRFGLDKPEPPIVIGELQKFPRPAQFFPGGRGFDIIGADAHYYFDVPTARLMQIDAPAMAVIHATRKHLIYALAGGSEESRTGIFVVYLP